MVQTSTSTPALGACFNHYGSLWAVVETLTDKAVAVKLLPSQIISGTEQPAHMVSVRGVWHEVDKEELQIGFADIETLDQLNESEVELLLRLQVQRKVAVYGNFKYREKEFSPGIDPIPPSGKVLGTNELHHLVDASLDGWLTTGRFNTAFEEKLASYIGVKHVLTTNSGSSANLLALAALTSPKLGDRALKPGDEYITTAAGFPTTVNPGILYGLTPVFVDIEIPTYNIDVTQLEAAVSEKTKAIMLAHTLGNPFNIDEVMRIARKYDLWVIEDCCDALGATYTTSIDSTDYKGRAIPAGTTKHVGTFGDIATLSFYPAHHITMGEGGAVFTDSGILKPIIESFRDWGRDCFCPPGCDNTCGKRFEWQLGDLPQGYDHKYIYSHLGYNLKITDMQAAVGLAQLDRIDDFVTKRRENFDFLSTSLNSSSDLIMPLETVGANASWFGFPITLSSRNRDRNSVVAFLEQNGIGTRLLFGGNLSKQPYFAGRHFRAVGPLPNTDLVMDRCFWVGLYPGLSEKQLTYSCAVLRDQTKHAL